MNAKKLLGDALVELMQESSIDRITVEQIVSQADVSKQTFYRYFSDKYDLLEWCFDEIVLKPFDDIKGKHDWYEGLVQHFHQMRANMQFVRNGYLSSDVNDLYACDSRLTEATIDRLLSEQGVDSSDPLIHFAVQKEVRGGIWLVREWVFGGMVMSDERMAELITETMPEAIKTYLIG